MAEGALLAGIRVLDLADARAELTGRILAELGAEILKIEPPGGVDSRRRGPYARGRHEHLGSLYWFTVGRGKRSAVVDIETAEGQAKVQELALRADILVESAPPGRMEGLKLGYAALRGLNPGLVYVSVSPYGQSGPKAQWPATELTMEAASGRLMLQGDRDRPPLPIGFSQVAFQAGALAAADAVTALNERDLSGFGQHLDLSMTEAMTWTLMNNPGYPPSVGTNPPGGGDDRGTYQSPLRAPFFGLSPCADGWVLATLTSRDQFLRAITESIVPGVEAAKAMPVELAGYDWRAWDVARAADALSEGQIAAAAVAVSAFFARKTRVELFEWAVERDIHLAPANPPHDLPRALPLEGRDFWVREGEGGPTVPAVPIITSRSGRLPLGAPAPALDADSGLVEEWLTLPPAQPSAPSRDRLGEAFAGVKIADFSWVAAGPLTAKHFADQGATVVRIESATRVDFARTLPPFKDGIPGINRSHWPNNLNTSKLGVALNLALPGARAIAKRLIDWADVVIENYTPGTMARWGFDYETLSRERPDLVMLSTSLMGQTGPLNSYAGYGTHGAAIAGLHAITGWPDREPSGPHGPYSDVIAPRYAVAALGAALLERRRTGKGQYFDISQIECAIHFVEPLLLDQGAPSAGPDARGLSSFWACPHGVYRTRGSERYVAIAVETEEQWQALLGVAPLERFAAEAFCTLESRFPVRDEIDAALAAWAERFEHRELEGLLIVAGVPAASVLRMTDVLEDPQMVSRGHFVTLRQSEIGEMPYDGLATRFSAKQTVLHKAAPCVGEDTEYVMRELLGMDDEEIASLAERGVFT